MIYCALILLHLKYFNSMQGQRGSSLSNGFHTSLASKRSAVRIPVPLYTLNQHFGGANFLLFLAFSSFFQLFSTKYLEKTYFNQSLECAASKPWSKYTTGGWRKSCYITVNKVTHQHFIFYFI